MGTTENSGRIELDGDLIRYRSGTYPEWTIRIEDVRIIGEATNQNGPFTDDYFLYFAPGPKMWYEASFYAAGRDAFLAALGARLGVTVELMLTGSTDFASRILWPNELAGEPMFQYHDVPPKSMLGRLFGLKRVRQSFSDQVLAALER